MVRLLHVDLLRAHLQGKGQDTGYLTVRDYEEMRDYIDSWFGLYEWQVAGWHEGRPTGEDPECWIWVPATTSPNYRTNRLRWGTILRRWPQFIDPEAL